MKRIAIKSFGLGLTVLFVFILFGFKGNETGKLTVSQNDTLKKYLHGLPSKTQLAFAIVKDDKVFYTGVILNNDSISFIENRDSVFEIGSLTKVFTSELLSVSIDKGLVKLTDTLGSFFNFPLKQSSLAGVKITLQNLANHTSGLPKVDISMLAGANINNPYASYDEQKLDDYLQNKMHLDTIPGTKFSYSNLGGGLLGFILCKKSNKTYEQLLQENIFIPLGMKNSTTNLALAKSKLVRGRGPTGDTASNWTFTDAAAGAGAIKSCVTDMVKFMQANFSPNKIFDLPRVKTFSIKPGMDIGLGWIIKTEKDKEPIYWHNGGTMGYRSILVMQTHKKNGIIILSNISAANPLNANLDKLGFALLGTL